MSFFLKLIKKSQFYNAKCFYIYTGIIQKTKRLRREHIRLLEEKFTIYLQNFIYLHTTLHTSQTGNEKNSFHFFYKKFVCYKLERKRNFS